MPSGVMHVIACDPRLPTFARSMSVSRLKLLKFFSIYKFAETQEFSYVYYY